MLILLGLSDDEDKHPKAHKSDVIEVAATASASSSDLPPVIAPLEATAQVVAETVAIVLPPPSVAPALIACDVEMKLDALPVAASVPLPHTDADASVAILQAPEPSPVQVPEPSVLETKTSESPIVVAVPALPATQATVPLAPPSSVQLDMVDVVAQQNHAIQIPLPPETLAASELYDDLAPGSSALPLQVTAVSQSPQADATSTQPAVARVPEVAAVVTTTTVAMADVSPPPPPTIVAPTVSPSSSPSPSPPPPSPLVPPSIPSLSDTLASLAMSLSPPKPIVPTFTTPFPLLAQFRTVPDTLMLRWRGLLKRDRDTIDTWYNAAAKFMRDGLTDNRSPDAIYANFSAPELVMLGALARRIGRAPGGLLDRGVKSTVASHPTNARVPLESERSALSRFIVKVAQPKCPELKGIEPSWTLTAFDHTIQVYDAEGTLVAVPTHTHMTVKTKGLDPKLRQSLYQASFDFEPLLPLSYVVFL